jgi:regulator of sigma E protease
VDFLTNTLAFVFALGIIIFVHEGGHYLMAKAFDVRVLTFSLGFGRKIFGFTRGETEYKVCWVPLGGYVRLGGETPEESTADDPRDFQNKPRWQRILVYLAGPVMNVLLAILLIAIVLMVGFGLPFLHEIPPVVGTIEPGSPAASAGLLPGDEITGIAGKPVESWETVAMTLLESPGKPVAIAYERGGEARQATVVPRTVPKYEVGDAGMYPKVLPSISALVKGMPAAAAGFQPGDEVRAIDGRALASDLEFVNYIAAHPGQQITVTVLREGKLLELPVVPKDDGSGKGKIGVSLTLAQRLGPVQAFVESTRYNWNIAKQTLGLVGKLVRREMKAKSALHGPIEIAALSGEAVRQGLPNLLHLMGLVSISIAILNLLPIPVLDGGQISILLVESVFRRDLSLRLKEAVNMVGLAFIVLLMVTVLFFDLQRNWPFSGGEDAATAGPAPTQSPVPGPTPAAMVPAVQVP